MSVAQNNGAPPKHPVDDLQDGIGKAVSTAMDSNVSPFSIIGCLDFMKANIAADMRAVHIRKMVEAQKKKPNIIHP